MKNLQKTLIIIETTTIKIKCKQISILLIKSNEIHKIFKNNKIIEGYVNI